VLNDVGIVSVACTVPPALGVTVEGVMLAWVPGGRPAVTCRLTGELNPLSEVTVIVYDAVCPC
jgi:hypothetical protein